MTGPVKSTALGPLFRPLPEQNRNKTTTAATTQETPSFKFPTRVFVDVTLSRTLAIFFSTYSFNGSVTSTLFPVTRIGALLLVASATACRTPRKGRHTIRLTQGFTAAIMGCVCGWPSHAIHAALCCCPHVGCSCNA